MVFSEVIHLHIDSNLTDALVGTKVSGHEVHVECLILPQIRQLFGVEPERQHWFRFAGRKNNTLRPSRYLVKSSLASGLTKSLMMKSVHSSPTVRVSHAV